MSAPSAASPSKRDVYLITGSNTGVGYQTALQLALGDKASRRHIVLACRTPSKAQAAVERIQNAIPTGQVTYVEWIELDLADLKSIRRCVEEIKQRKLAVKVLVNNAGVNLAPKLSPETFQVDGQFVANYLSHYILTKALLPILEANAPARVVNVSSYMHRTAGRPDFAVECRLSNSRSYSTSKLAQIVWARAVYDKMHQKGVTFSVVHPGACASDIWNTLQAPAFIRSIVKSVAHTIFLSTEQGAASSVHAATKELTEEDKKSLEHFGPYPAPLPGWSCLTDAWQPNYFTRVTKSDTSVVSRDEKLGEAVVKLSEELEKEWEKATVAAVE